MASLVQRLIGYVRGSAGPLPPEEYFRQEKVWTGVQSSNVKAVAYYADLRAGAGRGNVLAVRFLNGGEYWYFGVPLPVYVGMLAASSKGRYVHENLKGRYSYQRKQ